MICPGFLLDAKPFFSRLSMIFNDLYWILSRFWPFWTDFHWFLLDFEPFAAVFQ